MKRWLILPVLIVGTLSLAAVGVAGPTKGKPNAKGGKFGQTLLAGRTGKLHGYLQGTVSGGTFNPNGTCTTTCSAGDFVAGFFTSGATFTCNLGYAGCRFSFEYTAQRHKRQGLRYHHWVDRGIDGVHEIFIGDI